MTLTDIARRHGLPVPTEDAEQRVVVQWLTLHGILFTHVPNGGHRNKVTAAKLKGQGVRPGVPDILIFDAPPLYPTARGVAIEMKRAKGGQLSSEQREWLEKLEIRGWAVYVARGADDALAFLKSLGWGRP